MTDGEVSVEQDVISAREQTSVVEAVRTPEQMDEMEPLTPQERVGGLIGSIQGEIASIDEQLELKGKVAEAAGEESRLQKKEQFKEDLHAAEEELKRQQKFADKIEELLQTEVATQDSEAQATINQLSETTAPKVKHFGARVRTAEARLTRLAKMREAAKNLPQETRDLESTRDFLNKLQEVATRFNNEYVVKTDELRERIEARNKMVELSEELEEPLEGGEKLPMDDIRTMIINRTRGYNTRLQTAEDPFGFLKVPELRQELDKYGVWTGEMEKMLTAYISGEEIEYDNSPVVRYRQEAIMGIIEKTYPKEQTVETQEEGRAGVAAEAPETVEDEVNPTETAMDDEAAAEDLASEIEENSPDREELENEVAPETGEEAFKEALRSSLAEQGIEGVDEEIFTAAYEQTRGRVKEWAEKKIEEAQKKHKISRERVVEKINSKANIVGDIWPIAFLLGITFASAAAEETRAR